MSNNNLDNSTACVIHRYGTIVTPDMLAGDDGANINGPSLIRVPDWIPNPLGKYYLYFAHHKGTYIRLAYADTITGPWHVFRPGTLGLAHCPIARRHIASPDVHVDESRRRIIMYFHGPTAVRVGQRTFVARSGDGLRFEASSKILGPPYARIFRHGEWQRGSSRGNWYYGLFGTGGQTLYRSMNGLDDFESGPVVLPVDNGVEPHSRHVAVYKTDDRLYVYYTQRFAAPERILFGTVDLTQDWRKWYVAGANEVLRPELPYEGFDVPIKPSMTGMSKSREHALRDPAIYHEDGRTWLLYVIAGESGIALAEIEG